MVGDSKGLFVVVSKDGMFFGMREGKREGGKGRKSGRDECVRVRVSVFEKERESEGFLRLKFSQSEFISSNDILLCILSKNTKQVM